MICHSGRQLAETRFQSQPAATTTSATIAARGRYMRCSAPDCVMTGTTLELGARMQKKQAPRKPSGRYRREHKAASVAAASDTTRTACGRKGADGLATWSP